MGVRFLDRLIFGICFAFYKHNVKSSIFYLNRYFKGGNVYEKKTIFFIGVLSGLPDGRYR